MRQHSTIRRHRTDRLMTGTSFKEDPGTRIKSIAPCNIFGSQDLATQADGITDRRVEMSQRKSVRSEEVLKRREREFQAHRKYRKARAQYNRNDGRLSMLGSIVVNLFSLRST